ncbi:MAG: pathogenicity protein [Rhodanobacteraceae bacterium]|nr:MAG: pathogenicity protein [Rhodanobacteraceae bacterium]
MTRARQWWLGTGAAIGVVALLLAVLLVWLVYTPSGLRFALNRGNALLHGQFTYASASGTLGGTAHLTGLYYRDASGDVLRVSRATISLRPWALLGQRLHVRRARIEGITLELARPKSTGKSQPFSLAPPLAIELADTQLTHIAVHRAGQPAFAAGSLDIAGVWSDSRLVIRRLALAAPAGHAALEGTLAVARGYRGHGRVTFDWARAGTRYAGSVTSTADGRTAKLDAALTGPVPLQLTATIGLGTRHAWSLGLTAAKFDARAIPALPAPLHTLALDIHGTGDVGGGKLTGTVTANGHALLLDPVQFRYDGQTLTLDPLRLRSPEIAGSAALTGAVHLDTAPISVDLDAEWKDVALPAHLAGQPFATHGNLHLAGNTAHFAVNGTLAAGPPGRLSSLRLDLAGTPHAINVRTMQLLQTNGGLEITGHIGLQPMSWQLTARAHKLDPGTLLAGWSGALDFTLASHGTWSAQGPAASVTLAGVTGTLRGRNLAGSHADLAITPDNWLTGSLLLVAGHSRIQARGQPGPQTHATVILDVASLNDWLPGTSGALRGQFTVAGRRPKLAIAGQLQGQHLQRGTLRIAALRLTAALPDFAQAAGNFNLALEGVHATGLDFKQVRLDASGTANAHRLRLHASGTQLDAALALAGSWNANTRRWTGILSDAEFASAGMPAWRQQQPGTITWQGGALTLAEVCLSAGTPRLCVAGRRDARGALTGKYSLHGLPLQLLASLAGGGQPLAVSGDVSGTGAFQLDANGALTGHAALAASAGTIALAATANRPLLAWSGLAVEATAKGSSQHIALHGILADGGDIRGDVTLTGTRHALAGTVNVDLRSLAVLDALSPEIANARGTAAGALTLAGTLAAPQFSGRIEARDFAAEVPRAGIELHAGAFVVAGDAQGRLTVTGQVTSGAGVLHVNGTTGLAANAPLSLALQGSDVLVADLPAARVMASPDLRIARRDGVFSVTGSITIPSARVEVEKLPGRGPAAASPDVVVVDAPPTAKVAPLAMTAAVQVKLGAAVKVQGYGLDGTVHGQLAVNVQPGRSATGRGEIRVAGNYQAYGQNLSIERGRLLFAGTRLDDPGLDIRAVRTIRSQDVTVGLAIRGTAQRPILTVFSDPAMEQAEALSYLVTGRPLDALKSGEGDTLNTAAQALGGLAGDRLAKSIGSRLGLEAGVASSEALGGSAFTAGKYLSPRLFVSYGVGLFTPGQVVTLRYTLNRFLQFEAENATSGNRASLNYQIEK